MTDFKGKTAVIIEGNRRIGKAVSLALAGRGAKIIVIASGEDTAFLSQLRLQCPGAELLTVEYANTASVDSAIAHIQKNQQLDIIINYANTESLQLNMSAVTRSAEDWESLIDINAFCFHSSLHALLPIVTKQRNGCIVNVADSPICGAAAYLLLANTMTHFTRSLGRVLARKNIRLNAVIPGPLEGEDYQALFASYQNELAWYFPIARPATLEEIVEPVLFLASDKASYMFGSTIRVDAGFSA